MGLSNLANISEWCWMENSGTVFVIEEAGKPDIKIPDYPLTIGMIFRLSTRFYRAVFWKVTLLTLAIYSPLEIFLEIQNPGGPFKLKDFTNQIKLEQAYDLFVGVIVTMTIAILVQQASQGPVRPSVALKGAMNRWHYAILTNLMAGVVSLGLLLLGIIPGIIWMLYYSFVSYVVAIRKKSGWEALRYSKSLVKGHWWRTLGFIISFYLAALFAGISISLVLAMGGEIIAPLVPGHFPLTVLLDLFSALVIQCTFTFSTIATTILFLNVERGNDISDFWSDKSLASASPSF